LPFFNALGAKVQSFGLTMQKGTNTIMKPLASGLIPGTYILEVVTPTDRTAVKLVK
jgi:hypothetical protein